VHYSRPDGSDPQQDVKMPATQTAPRPKTRPAIPADRVRELLLELTYRMHTTRPVAHVAAASRQR
jgi:hypothetical protein